MKLISHRGNVNGRLESYENNPTYIDLAISKGYDVEIDIWFEDNTIWLGHDKPDHTIDLRWILDRISYLWIHCKNIEAVLFFTKSKYDFNYFWHETDTITLTSQKYIWAYPGKQPIMYSIAVMPELFNEDISNAIGICSDYIERYNFEI